RRAGTSLRGAWTDYRARGPQTKRARQTRRGLARSSGVRYLGLRGVRHGERVAALYQAADFGRGLVLLAHAWAGHAPPQHDVVYIGAFRQVGTGVTLEDDRHRHA